MVQAEIHRRELATIHQHHGQGIAKGQGHQGRGRGRQAVGTGFRHLGHGQADGGVAAQEAGGALGDGDDGDAVALAIDQRIAQFAALARVRQREQGHVGPQHAQVAVAHFGGVDEEGVGAGRSQGRGDLVADMARLAHAGDDDIAGSAHDNIDGAGHRHIDRTLQRLQRLDVQPDDLACALGHAGDVFGGRVNDLGHALTARNRALLL